MSITNLSTAAERIESRIMNVFIQDLQDADGDTDSTDYFDFGIVRDVEVSLSEVTQDADVSGREKQLTSDIEVSFVMQQTAAEEFGAVQDIVASEGSGETIRATTEPASASSAGSVKAFEFENVFPNVSGTMNGSGEGSYFTVTFNGRVNVEELANVPSASTNVTVGA
jgi:hypothetical protein